MALSHDLTEATNHALTEVDRAIAAGWLKVNGEPAEANLRRIREWLSALLEQQQEANTAAIALSDVTKWVADWIPHLDDSLIPALARVEALLRANELGN